MISQNFRWIGAPHSSGGCSKGDWCLLGTKPKGIRGREQENILCKRTVCQNRKSHLFNDKLFVKHGVGYYSVFFLSVQCKIRGVTVSYHVQWPLMLLFSVQLPATLHTITCVVIILTGFIYCSPEFTWQGLPNDNKRKKIFWLREVACKFDLSHLKSWDFREKIPKNPTQTKQRKNL